MIPQRGKMHKYKGPMINDIDMKMKLIQYLVCDTRTNTEINLT